MLTIRLPAPSPPKASARAGVVPRLFLPLLALLAACEDPARPAVPTEPSAAVAGSATAAAAPSAAPKAYALVENTGASGYVVNGNTYNPAGSVWVERVDVGRYRVEFRHIAYSQITGSPHYQVKPVRRFSTASGNDFCGHWGRQVGGSLHVDVSCTRGPAATYTDMPFVVQVFDGSAAVAYTSIASGGAWGFAQHVARVVRETRGQYHVFFRKDPLFSNGALPAAFVSWGRKAVGCQIARLGSSRELAGELGVEIVCKDRSGYAQDTEVHVLAVPQAVKTGYAFVAGSPMAPVPERSYNASGASIVATQTGAGKVEVTFNSLGTYWPDNGTVTVSAVGTNNASCAIDSWARAPRGGTASGSNFSLSVRIAVQCRTPNGLLTTTPFTVLALARP